MTRQQFNAMRQANGAYLAALAANIAGVTLANVQAWLRTNHS